MTPRKQLFNHNMRFLRRILTFLLFNIAFWVPYSTAAEPLNVYVVNYPLKYFAERIGGDHVEVHLPVPAGEDPAFWMPDVETIAAYQQADLVLLNGAGYAKWIKKVSLPGRKLVNTSAAFEDEYIPVEEVVTHKHGPAGDHSHAGIAFTTWLDLDLASRQAKSISTAFSQARPELRNTFEANLQALDSELKRLDTELQKIGKDYAGRPVFASHPVYQYFARRYGLNIQSVTWEPDSMPEPAQWQAFSRLLQQYPASIMLWEREPLPGIRGRLEDMGIDVVVFDPSMNIPVEGDFLEKMQSNIAGLSQAVE